MGLTGFNRARREAAEREAAEAAEASAAAQAAASPKGKARVKSAPPPAVASTASDEADLVGDAGQAAVGG